MTHHLDPARCPACGYPAPVVWVHGHGQCSACGINIEPCCGGAPCPNPTLSPASSDEPAGDGE